MYAKEPGIELLCELAYHRAFAGSIPSFEANDRGNVRSPCQILQLAQTLLQFRHRLLIGELRQTFL